MSHNRFGHLFTITTFGESHGPAIGVVIDGCPPGLEIEADEIRWRETVVQGLEQAPEAFIGLFRGDNVGKMVVAL